MKPESSSSLSLSPNVISIQVIGFVPQLHSHFFMFCLSNTHISSYCDYFVAPSVQSGNIYTSFDSKWSLKVYDMLGPFII